MIRVLDARLFHRAPEGKLTEIDLNPLLADPPPAANPLAHLLGTNGGGGNGGMAPRRRSTGRRASRSRTCAG